MFGLFSDDILHYLWYYVLTPGNLLATLFALFTPYLVRYNLLPYIYHPYRYGGIPFVAPPFFELQMMYYVFIIACITFSYFIAGYMGSLKVCRYSDYKIVLYNYPKLLVLLLICVAVLVFLPFVKIPLLTVTSMLPFAGELINGVFWALATFIGIAWANRFNVYQICGK